jgi:predicted DNA-binding transcriptional regulator AlpA
MSPPTLAVRADQAADALGVSQSTFLSLVAEGRMPKPIPVPGHRGLVLYDFKAVEDAWAAMVAAAGADGYNEWDENPFDG